MVELGSTLDDPLDLHPVIYLEFRKYKSRRHIGFQNVFSKWAPNYSTNNIAHEMMQGFPFH